MERKQETIIKIEWGSGRMSFIAEQFFPITAEKMTKLYKKCIRFDYEHRDEIIEQILKSLNQKKEDLKRLLDFQLSQKANREQELALTRDKAEKERIRNAVSAIKEDVRNTNQTLKQVQKNIEQLQLLSAAKK